jgi:hypothetical protein
MNALSDSEIGLTEAIKHWLLSVFLTLVLPVIPLVVEWAISGTVSVASAVLGASMYSISTGLVCRNGPVLGCSVILAIFYTALFGAVMLQTSSKQVVTVGDFFALRAMLGLFLANLIIKFIYHVIDRRPFADLWLRSE